MFLSKSKKNGSFSIMKLKKRSFWNTGAWHIGVEKKGRAWTWKSGKELDTLKRRDFVATVSESHAEITKNGGRDVIARGDSRAFICEMAQG